MIATWMLYSVAVSAMFGLCALALEHGVRRSGMPVRWLWAGALLASLVVSALPWMRSGAEARMQSAAVVLGEETVMEYALPMPVYAPAAKLDVSPPPGLLARLEALDRPLLTLWAVAAGLGMLYLLGTHRTLARRRRFWRKTMVDGVPALLSRDVGPAVVGFLDSAIVVPGWVTELDAEQRRLVLAHEEEHLLAGDARLLSVALVAVALAPWNAPLWWQLRRLRHAVELDCDARVLDGDADAERYCDLLIEVGARASMRGVAFAAFAESSSFLERRIMSVVGPRPRRWTLAAGLCVTLAGFLALYACEAPIPTLPAVSEESEVPEVVALDAAPERVLYTEVVPTELDTTVLWTEEVPLNSLPVVVERREEVSSRDVAEVVRRRYPEVYSGGLPPEQTVWLVIDRTGRLVSSWIGQNIYLPFEHYRPMREQTLPEGSTERARAVAEHEELERSIMAANAPGMRAGGVFAAYYYFPPAQFGVHIITETNGERPPGWRTSPVDYAAVNAALRAELRR